MPDLHKNFGYSTVATAPSPATSGTSLIVAAGQGALFPTPPFNAVVWPAGAQPLTTNSEIVRVTGISTDTLTIARGATSGGGLNGEPNNQNRSIIIGDQIDAGITVKTLTDAEGTAAVTASTPVQWDANGNLSANQMLPGYATTATAASTTTLLVGSAQQQFFTGSTTQTVKMPVAATLALGQSFTIVNNSTGVVTVQSSGGNTILALLAGEEATFTCILASGTTAASWSVQFKGVLGYVQITSPVTTTATSDTQATGLTDTLVIPIGIGQVEIEAYCPSLENSAANNAFLTLWNGTVGSGTRLQQAEASIWTLSAFAVTIVKALLQNPTPGSFTFNVGFYGQNAGTTTINAAATAPTYLIIKAV